MGGRGGVRREGRREGAVEEGNGVGGMRLRRGGGGGGITGEGEGRRR